MDEEESGVLRARRDDFCHDEAAVKGGSDGPEDVDAAFAQIVEGLEREGVGSDLADLSVTADLPDDEQAANEPKEEIQDIPELSAPVTAAWRGHETEMDWAWSTDDDHYVPPEPPPIPKPSPLTVLALVLMLIALFLLVAPGVIGLATRVATPVALVSAAVGIGLVVLRIRQSQPPDSDRDDGAQV
jgi:hypothetical protein